MKELKVFAIYLLVILAVLATLMGLLAGNSTTVSDDRNAMIEMWRNVSWYAVPPQDTSHGQDGVIQWQDAGMEAHIRFLLRKPEGEILKSEVWGIQVLDIQPNYHTAHDTMLTTLPEGWDAFTYAGVTGTTRFWEYYEGATFPPIENLKDLVHFDSLQILSINLKPEDSPLSDLSGLAQRPNLRVVQLSNCTPESLEAIGRLRELTHLTLESCGTVDLQPLADLQQLTALSLRETAAPSLEPITALPCLSYLDLACWPVYPPLEPLTRSTLAYLELSTLPEEPDPFIPDPQSIFQIPDLTALSLSYLPGVDASFCQELLAQCETLLYLDIYGTPAAAQADGMNRSRLTAFVYE